MVRFCNECDSIMTGVGGSLPILRCRRCKRIEYATDIIEEKRNDIISLFQTKGITHFNHVIHLDYLDSYFKNGLLSRNEVNRSGIEFYDLSKNIYQSRRSWLFNREFPQDDVHNYVPLYISSHTPMVHKYVGGHFYKVVLKINVLLLNSLSNEDLLKVKISNESINQANNDSLIINNLFSSSLNLNRFLNWDVFNDKEDLSLSKAAEILIPNRIDPRFIDKICPKPRKAYYIERNYDFSEEIWAKFDWTSEEFIF